VYLRERWVFGAFSLRSGCVLFTVRRVVGDAFDQRDGTSTPLSTTVDNDAPGKADEP
jgi:hypothetical protein